MSNHQDQDQNQNQNQDRLRERARERMVSMDQDAFYADIPDNPEEIHSLIEDLRIHQIEMEMQNEELRTTQESLRKSVRRYTDLYDRSPVGYASISRDTRIREINLTACDMLNAPRQQLLQQRLNEYIHPEDQDSLYFFLQKITDPEIEEACEIRLQPVNANAFHTRIEGRLSVKSEEEAEGDRIEEIRIAFSDIETLKQTEHQLQETNTHLDSLVAERTQALRESQERLELALWAAKLAWWDWDYRSGHVTTSAGKAAMLGYDPETVKTSVDDWIARIHPEDYDLAMNRMREHLQGMRDVYEIHYRLKSNDGGWKWFYDRGKVVQRSPEGSPLRLVGAVQNIDSLQRAEQERELLYNHAMDMFTIITFTGKVKQANPAWSSNLGWNETELQEMDSMEELIHPEDRALVAEDDGSLKHETALHAELRMQHKDGEYRWLAWNIIPFAETETLLTVSRDITEKKQAEEALREHKSILESEVRERTTDLQKTNQELEQLVETKNRLFSIIAHDLRTPIGNFRNASELLLEGDLDEETGQTLLEDLKESAEHTLGLLENLLHWGRNQLDSVPFDPEIEDLYTLLNKNIDFVSHTLESKQIQLKRQYPEALAAWMDKNMVDTVIRNLLHNALKYTPSGGEITVAGIEQNDTTVQISVRDSGRGMTAKEIESILSRKTGSSKPGTAGEKGTGLGLMICQDFLKRHGSELQIHSVPDQGSEFSFILSTAPE